MNDLLLVSGPALLILLLLWGARLVRGSNHHSATARRRFRQLVCGQMVIFSLVYIAALWWTLIAPHAQGAGAQPPAGPAAAAAASLSIGDGIALLGVAVATGLAVMGAGQAVGIVGAAALGVISEKPEMLGRTLVFIGLAEGLAIYGLIISILLLQQLH
jgi:V/A-type H+/Na+-transporting ATPase subunit K